MSQKPSQMTVPVDEGGSHKLEDVAALVAKHPLLAGLPVEMAALVTG